MQNAKPQIEPPQYLQHEQSPHGGRGQKIAQRLIQRKERPKLTLTDWRRYWEHRRAANKSDDYLLDVTDKFHVRTLANRRTVHILIALRRFKNKTGHWPQSLDQIEPQLSRETLTDPRSNTPFVYELEGENFKLHSKEAD